MIHLPFRLLPNGQGSDPCSHLRNTVKRFRLLPNGQGSDPDKRYAVDSSEETPSCIEISRQL
jgi:hypothetical protein